MATAATMARILSAVPQCITGPSTVVIYDIHALQEQFYFSDNVLIQLESASELLQKRMRALPDYDRISIVFPDDGAAKRFKKNFPSFPFITCLKVRHTEIEACEDRGGTNSGP